MQWIYEAILKNDIEEESSELQEDGKRKSFRAYYLRNMGIFHISRGILR